MLLLDLHLLQSLSALMPQHDLALSTAAVHQAFTTELWRTRAADGQSLLHGLHLCDSSLGMREKSQVQASSGFKKVLVYHTGLPTSH